ncbi:MAG: thiamine-phosphate pyrophosphorylase, partial [Thermococcaceae archaeon]|nr:thiamine-phosphate pyrophosphorylase [Thermococcaceae archaeon]
ADGVQLGPEDMPISLARDIAPNLIIGASVYSLEEALIAEKEGADYLGAGSVFPTSTKRDVKVIGLEGLRKILESVKIPVVAIGGINHENVREVLKTGVDGVAVISAIIGAKNVRKATEDMRRIVEEMIK